MKLNTSHCYLEPSLEEIQRQFALVSCEIVNDLYVCIVRIVK